jgi:Ser/Thr protein kinase RdoA (MazF antagonist)
VAARRESLDLLEQARAAGQIPERLVHGDPKLDNLLFDAEGRRALALIDLDTVQPGLTLHDIGDCLRSCCNRQGESASKSRVGFDLAVCLPLLQAYADRTQGLLVPAEVTLLFAAIRLIPFELGLRFLTDHLQGNPWFRVSAPGQNLAKARIQFSLVADIEGKEREIQAIIAACFGGFEGY